MPSFFSATLTLGVLLDCTALLFLISSRQLRKWPSIGGYLVASLFADAVMHTGHPTYAVRFYTYWTWYSVAALLRFWILSDILRSFPGAEFIRPHLRYMSVLTGMTAAAVALWWSIHDPRPHVSPFMAFSLAFDTAVLIAWGAFVAGALACVYATNIVWDRQAVGIARGVAVKSTLGVLGASLLNGSHGTRLFGQELLAVASLFNLAFWAVALVPCRKTERQPLLAAES